MHRGPRDPAGPIYFVRTNHFPSQSGLNWPHAVHSRLRFPPSSTWLYSSQDRLDTIRFPCLHSLSVLRRPILPTVCQLPMTNCRQTRSEIDSVMDRLPVPRSDVRLLRSSAVRRRPTQLSHTFLLSNMVQINISARFMQSNFFVALDACLPVET